MTDYDPTLWVNNEAPALSAANLNKMESGIDTAHDEIDALDARVDTLETTPSGITLIEHKVAVGGSVANFDFTDIPDTFKHLRLVMALRSERASVNRTVCYIRCNGDAGGNYAYRWNGYGGATVQTGGGSIGITGAEMCQIPGSTAPVGGHFGTITVDIMDYLATDKTKAMVSQFGLLPVASDMWNCHGWGYWSGLTAIDQLTILDPTPANLTEGSIASLYGLV